MISATWPYPRTSYTKAFALKEVESRYSGGCQELWKVAGGRRGREWRVREYLNTLRGNLLVSPCTVTDYRDYQNSAY